MISHPAQPYPITSHPIISCYIPLSLCLCLAFPFLSFPFLSFPFLSFPFLSFPFLSSPLDSNCSLLYCILSYQTMSYHATYLRVCLIKPFYAHSGRHLPHLQLPRLTACRKILTVSAKSRAQDSLFVHH
jgi:hypothetical protein